LGNIELEQPALGGGDEDWTRRAKEDSRWWYVKEETNFGEVRASHET
jgi:hypothetical protein